MGPVVEIWLVRWVAASVSAAPAGRLDNSFPGYAYTHQSASVGACCWVLSKSPVHLPHVDATPLRFQDGANEELLTTDKNSEIGQTDNFWLV